MDTITSIKNMFNMNKIPNSDFIAGKILRLVNEYYAISGNATRLVKVTYIKAYLDGINDANSLVKINVNKFIDRLISSNYISFLTYIQIKGNV